MAESLVVDTQFKLVSVLNHTQRVFAEAEVVVERPLVPKTK
jgi:hypothetical protein